jgi:hypothetical protein
MRRNERLFHYGLNISQQAAHSSTLESVRLAGRSFVTCAPVEALDCGQAEPIDRIMSSGSLPRASVWMEQPMTPFEGIGRAIFERTELRGEK